MNFLNYNNMIRNYILKKLDYEQENYKDNIKKFYNEMKSYSFKEKKELLCILMLTSYIVNYFTYKKFPKEKELSEVIKYIENINNIDELVDNISLDFFEKLCDDLIFYHTLDNYSKREYVSKIRDKKDFLLKVMPLYIYDLINYSFEYNKELIIYKYNNKYANSKDENIAMDYAVKYAYELLINLDEYNYDNFKKIIDELLAISYCYNKYFEKNLNYQIINFLI